MPISVSDTDELFTPSEMQGPIIPDTFSSREVYQKDVVMSYTRGSQFQEMGTKAVHTLTCHKLKFLLLHQKALRIEDSTRIATVISREQFTLSKAN